MSESFKRVVLNSDRRHFAAENGTKSGRRASSGSASFGGEWSVRLMNPMFASLD